MTTNPFFSIIIPTYNRAQCLGVCIQSVFQQSYRDWELIVIDDGSTDDTKARVGEYRDKRLRYYYQKNQERCVARNNGIVRAKGRYICFLDSDDYLLEHHLQVFYRTIEKAQEKTAIFRTGFFYKKGKKLLASPFYNKKKYRHPIPFFMDNMVGIHTLCIHRDILQKHQFPPTFYHWQDTHLLLRILADYPFFQIPEHTCVYVFHEAMGTQSIYHRKDSQERMELNVNAIRHLFDHYGEKLTPFAGKYARNYVVAMKYIHHANGALSHKKYQLAFELIKKAMRWDKKAWFWWWYLKFFIKFPFYFVKTL